MNFPPPPAPLPSRSRWRRPGVIIGLLVVFPPVGIVLAWRSGWARQRKIVATVLSALWLIFAVAIDSPEDDAQLDTAASDVEETQEPEESPQPTTPEENADPARPVPDYAGDNLADAESAASEAGYRTTSHDASDDDADQWDDTNWTVCFQSPGAGEQAAPDATIDFAVVRNGTPCPEEDGLAITYPTVPDTVGMTFTTAGEALAAVGLTDVTADSAYIDVELPETHGDWLVCFQRPEAGGELRDADATSATLSLTSPSTDCPPDQSTELNPAPPPAPDLPDPDSSAYYENCDAVRAAGKAPLYRNDPGYRRALDRDNDGTACDT
ncbi:excalibur calcium-binding domain-containing protein [Streptomyces sp. NPDC049879]|uniref:excalibur calcium-binding domain-containing protein n=1 Tax=Streptomyces sp. NPDC049879 TaxID=3365598 RepID=UPI0037BAE19B